MSAPSPLVLSVEQKNKILSILNEKLFYEVRAGKLMRNFNHVLGFSCTASLLYRDIAGLMGASKTRRPDEVQVGISVMRRWMSGRSPQGSIKERASRAVQNDIRELTLSGPLPLIEKRVQGGLGGKRTVYSFVTDPFKLAERQLTRAKYAAAGEHNISTRAAIQIIDAVSGDRCLTERQVEWFAATDGEPEYDDPDEREYYWIRDHIADCAACTERVNLVIRSNTEDKSDAA